MQIEYMLRTVSHIYGNLLPRLKAKVSQLKQCLILGVLDLFQGIDNLTFEIHQHINILINIIRQIYYLTNNVLH